MLRLNLSSGPYWLELVPGVEVEVRPYGSTLLSEVWQSPAYADLAVGDALPAVAHAKAVARQAIIGWRGVGDETGAEIAPSPEAIDALLELPSIFGAFQSLYITPGRLVGAEGNGSAASPSGTSAAAEAIAPPVPVVARPARGTSKRRKA